MGVPGPGPGARARDGGVPGPGAAWRGGPGSREDEERGGGRGARAGLVILGVGGLCGAGGVGRGCIIIQYYFTTASENRSELIEIETNNYARCRPTYTPFLANIWQESSNNFCGQQSSILKLFNK